MSIPISQKDREVLRDLAKHQLELAHSERNQETIKEWYKHNDCESSRPLIILESFTFEQELIPKRLKCEGELARYIETGLYQNFLNFEVLGDDKVVPDYYSAYINTKFKPFDMNVKVEHAKTESLGHQFVHQITDLKEFSQSMKKSTYCMDHQGAEGYKSVIEYAIGDILPVKIECVPYHFVATQNLVHLMGMENMLISMYDYPEEFKRVMNRLADDYIEYLRFCEKENILHPMYDMLMQGSIGFTKKLPKKENRKVTKDIWGFMDSQESVGISPDMFKEFIFPAYKKVGENFGRLSYGCCEAVDPIWDNCISTFENLGKVSISPWCNQQIMGEKLKGKDVVFHRKPSPNYLGVDVNLDEEAVKAHIVETLKFAQGCTLEFSQRDVYTIHNNEEKAKRYIQIIREAIVENW